MVSVLLMSAMGAPEPVVAITAATVLLIRSLVGVDMQQVRSTGWRLRTDRRVQFWYQVLGIGMGAVLCVLLARLFMSAFPARVVAAAVQQSSERVGTSTAIVPFGTQVWARRPGGGGQVPARIVNRTLTEDLAPQDEQERDEPAMRKRRLGTSEAAGMRPPEGGGMSMPAALA